MKNKSIPKIAIMMILTLALAWGIGLLLEVLVYMIPTDRIRANIANGIDIYHSETNFYMYSDGYLSTMNDNDSDSVILGETAYSSGNPLVDALESKYPIIETDEWQPRINNTIAYSHFNDDEFSYYPYSRYWHGYVTILKPFFYFFDFADARVFNYIFQLLAYIIVGYLLAAKIHPRYLIAYFSLLVVFNPVIIALAFQYSPCTYIMLITMMILLKFQGVIADGRFMWVFMLSGILTAYFDFLTFPFVTLGVPSVLLLLTEDSNIVKMRKCFFSGLFWCVGYVGMWAGKWVLSSLILNRNVIEEAAEYVSNRTGNSDPLTTRSDAFMAVCGVLMKWPYLLIGVALICFVVVKYIIPAVKAGNLRKMFTGFAPFVFVAMYGVIWILFTYEHCYENQKFTYRELGITVFALLAGMLFAGNTSKGER